MNLFMFIFRYTFVDSTSPHYSIAYIASMNSVRGLGRVIVGITVYIYHFNCFNKIGNDLLDALELAAFDLSTDRTTRFSSSKGQHNNVLCMR
jgi:hypothetical protein